MGTCRSVAGVALTLMLGLVFGGCSGEEGFTVDPSIEAGINPYVYAWPSDEGSGDVDRQYLLYVPDEYFADPDEPWPLVLYLHGFGGSGHFTFEESATTGLPAIVSEYPYRYLMVAPYASEDDFVDPDTWAWHWWSGYLADLVDHVSTLVAVDSDRVYVTGHSAGGHGAWEMHSARPELAAAVMTLAGFWDYSCMTCDWPADWTKQYPDNTCEMAGTPTWVFHSLDDFVVDQAASQVMVDQLEACGGSDIRHTWYEDNEHRIEWRVFTDPEVVEWMLSQGHDGEWPALPADV